MDDLITECSVDSQATCVIDVFGLFSWHLSMAFYTTKHWQTSGRLVQKLNVCSVVRGGPFDILRKGEVLSIYILGKFLVRQARKNWPWKLNWVFLDLPDKKVLTTSKKDLRPENTNGPPWRLSISVSARGETNLTLTEEYKKVWPGQKEDQRPRWGGGRVLYFSIPLYASYS